MPARIAPPCCCRAMILPMTACPASISSRDLRRLRAFRPRRAGKTARLDRTEALRYE
jgi:hypothetical protein